MLLKQIILKNFRNFKEAKFNFSPILTIIIGENARGKTNLLESVFAVIHGEGFRDTVEKVFFVNKTKLRYVDYQKESTRAVLFSPEQIGIMTGSPDKRRKYFDSIIREFDIEYKKKLANYEIALRKRNKILETHFDEIQLKKEIAFWNDY